MEFVTQIKGFVETLSHAQSLPLLANARLKQALLQKSMSRGNSTINIGQNSEQEHNNTTSSLDDSHDMITRQAQTI